MIINMHKVEATATRVWEVSVHTYLDSPEKAYLLVKHGNMGGKIVERTKPVTVKNVGRSNETTAIAQAEFEALSLARKKMDENYKLTTPEQVAGKDGFGKRVHYLPMLAKVFEAKRLTGVPVIYVQPKLDGIRCIAYLQDGKVAMKTRKGKDIEVCTEIYEELGKVLADSPSVIFDGEIYKHGWNFQKITSATKKRNPDTALLEYHVFDLINDEPFSKRTDTLNTLLIHGLCRTKNSRLSPVLTERVIGNAEGFIEQCHRRYTEANYEGCMVRLNSCEYKQDKRSTELLKHKDFQDEEFTIIGGEKELLQNGNYGVIYKVQDPKRSTVIFNVRPTGTMEERTLELSKLPDVMGKAYKVRYQGKSDTNVPRFPTGVGIRAIG